MDNIDLFRTLGDYFKPQSNDEANEALKQKMDFIYVSQRKNKGNPLTIVGLN